jgi:type I restriction enzyme S subunit
MIETKTKLKHYEKYVDSGVEWMGEIPKHWEMKKIKFLSDIFNGDSLNELLKKKYESDDLNDLAYISSKDINLNNSEIAYENGLRIPKEDFSLKIAPSNSSLLCIEGGSAGRKIAFTNQEVCFVNKLACFKIKGNNYSKYLFFSLKGSPFQTQFKLSMTGMIGGVSISSINNFCLPLPPLSEQTKIAQFLDDKTNKIDAAVTIKEQQINLLKERKQILIHKAVTQGLNPNVTLKDSGVEWIGKIPKHWEVKKAKYLFNEIDERSINGKEELLSVSHMTGVTPRSEKNVSMFQSEDYSGSKLCKKNDLVFNIMWAWMGALGISDRTGIVSPSYAIYRQKITDTFNVYYLEALLGNIKYITHYNKVSTGLHSSRLRFYSRMFFDMKIGFPTKKDQDKIVDYMNEATNKIETAISLKQQEIEKLKEYNSSLINSVVTGKVRVC